MSPDDQAANDPDFDPLFTAVQRYTTPVATVSILLTLALIGWIFSS